MWPVLAYMQGDSPFTSAVAGIVGASGKHACYRCGTVTTPVEGKKGERWDWTLVLLLIHHAYTALLPQHKHKHTLSASSGLYKTAYQPYS